MEFVKGKELGEWLAQIAPKSRSIVIASPYITRTGLQPILAQHANPRRRLDVTILTSFEALSVLTGSLDVDVLCELWEQGNKTDAAPSVTIYDVFDLHAKVCIVDGRVAVIGSGNMTRGGTLGTNVELGVKVTARQDVAEVVAQVDGWTRGIRPITATEMKRFKRLVDENFKQYRGLPDVSLGHLQVFPGAEGDYFAAMQKVVKLASGRNGCTRAVLLESLKNIALGTDGAQTPQARLIFLELLGLVKTSEDNQNIMGTEVGAALGGRSGRKKFAVMLMSRYPIVQRTYRFLCDAYPRRITYSEMEAGLLVADDPNSASRGMDELQDSARWLRSLGLIEDDGHRPLRFHAKKPFLSSPVAE